MKHVDDISAADLSEPDRNPELAGLVWRRCLQLFSLPADTGLDTNSASASDCSSGLSAPLRPLLVGESTLLSVPLWRALLAECEQCMRARLAYVEARNGELVGVRVEKAGLTVEHEKGLPCLLSVRTLQELESRARRLDAALAAAMISARDGDEDEERTQAAARQSSKQAKKQQQQKSNSWRAKATGASSKSEMPFQFDSATHIAQTLKKGHLQDCSDQVVNFLALCLFTYALMLIDINSVVVRVCVRCTCAVRIALVYWSQDIQQSLHCRAS